MALVFKDVLLDLTNVPDKDKKEVKDRVADLLYNEVLRHVSRGKTPVKGETNFKILNKKYADREKQGNRIANLQLEGDLLREDFKSEALTRTDGVRIGHFNPDTADTEGEKADGHNQHSGKAKEWAASIGFPKRRYIPSAAQAFNDDIMSKVENIISKYRVSEPVDLAADALNEVLKSSGKVETVKQTTEITQISISDFLSEDYLAELIGDRLG